MTAKLFAPYTRPVWYSSHKTRFMFRAIGMVIVLWYLSSLFTHTFVAADAALSASFRTLEAAAVAGQKQYVE